MLIVMPQIRFSEWATVYGGIMSLKVANGTIIVVSDMTIAKELLDDRTSETASRPSLYAVDVVTGNNYFTLAKSGKYILDFNSGSLEIELCKDSHIWRMGRKAIQPLLAPLAVQANLPIAEAETTQLLYDILRDPEVQITFCMLIASMTLMSLPQEFYFHASRTTLSFVTSVVFGKPTPRYDSPDAILFRDYMRHFSSATSPAAAPVDLVPILKYVPERWAPWKQLWRETRRLQQSLYFSLLEYAENKDDSESGSKTFIKTILDRQTDFKLSREMVGYTGGLLLDAGAGTSASFIQSLILCLIKRPATMRKAQAEIDNVIGDSRLPIHSDIQDLPYIQAMIKEV
ncbi:hypothetical protein CVT25_003086 [Psilocybe cyanescens]|uniref:Cytochrome P450 n=1 Tax=Psilocybe cyanescens TaxID=93625 RepID=A0A409XQX9_PSICY|nr:hypothetical protein CVT25_003086 [Psilocybe cyanescens]